MASASLLTLLDDIASILDDVAAMTKVAAKKTAGVLGDDLALNAQQVSGVNADRELPVVWAVARGSLVNKVILVPLALAISALAPWLVQPLLMIGGLYLCFEGVEKIAHKLLHGKEATKDHADLAEALATPEVDIRAHEKKKIKGAVRTDFILSAEIIVIALGTVADAPFMQRVLTLALVAVVMTIGVYGLVASIVKLDDLGFWLRKKSAAILKVLGNGLVLAAPWLMKFLSVAGTVAMFLVGGGVLAHGIAPLHHLIEPLGAAAPLANMGIGLIAGAIALALIELITLIKQRCAH